MTTSKITIAAAVLAAASQALAQSSTFSYISGIPGGCNPAHPGSCPSSYFNTTATDFPTAVTSPDTAASTVLWTQGVTSTMTTCPYSCTSSAATPMTSVITSAMTSVMGSSMSSATSSAMTNAMTSAMTTPMASTSPNMTTTMSSQTATSSIILYTGGANAVGYGMAFVGAGALAALL